MKLRLESIFSQLLMHKWKVALGISALLLVSFFFFGKKSDFGPTLTVTKGDFAKQVMVSGTVISAQNVDLGFATNGRVAGVYATVGQHVRAGTVLAEMENGDLNAALTQKQYQLEAAQANLAELRSGTRPEEVAVASATLVSATAALVSAIQNAYTASDDAVHNKSDLLFTNPRTTPKLSFSVANATLISLVEKERASLEPVLSSWATLVTKLSTDNASASAAQAQTYLAQVVTFLADTNAALNQGISDQTTSSTVLSSYATTLATARANVNTSATALTSATAAFLSAQKDLSLKQAGATPDAIAAQEAVVAAAAADVQNARSVLAKTRVVAPFDGVVTRMDAKVGEIISPTSAEITMQSDGIFEIETYVPEVSVAGVLVGNTATTTLDAYGPSVPFPATVVAVDPAETVKDGVPTYKTTLAFLKNDPRIRSGMTTNVVITTGVLPGAIVIPQGAIASRGSVQTVSVLKNGVVVQQTVTTGPAPMLGQAQVLSGLSAGDVILLTPSS